LTRASRVFLGVAVALLGAATAGAQIQYSFYGQASGGTLRFQQTPHIYGGVAGFFATKQAGPVAIGVDVRGGVLGRGDNHGPNTDTALNMGQGGLRVAAAPGILPHSLQPYGEVLTGAGIWRGGVGVLRQDANHAYTQFIAGLDYDVTPRLAWRVVEFSYGILDAAPGHNNPMILSTGIVIRIP
jgi:hypothetical protein